MKARKGLIAGLGLAAVLATTTELFRYSTDRSARKYSDRANWEHVAYETITSPKGIPYSRPSLESKRHEICMKYTNDPSNVGHVVVVLNTLEPNKFEVKRK